LLPIKPAAPVTNTFIVNLLTSVLRPFRQAEIFLEENIAAKSIQLYYTALTNTHTVPF